MIRFVPPVMTLILIVAFLLSIYGALLLSYWKEWQTIPGFEISGSPQTSISVIIPARNEEKNIGTLLQKLKEQSYPEDLFEIIVIDDHSEDNTVNLIQGFPSVKLLRLKEDNINSYKKKAIETGIEVAKNEWIVSTDADCLPGRDWLKSIAGFIEKNKPVFIAAPVACDNDHSMLQIFQSLDFLVLQGVTGVAVQERKMPLCNGANIAYLRKIFFEVDGFKGIDDVASGDDILFMQKIVKKYPAGCQYLKAKTAIVLTTPMKTTKAFFNQRIRWASKSKKYKDKRLLATLFLVYFFNLSFPAFLIAMFTNQYPFKISFGYWFLILWLIKTLVELPFVSSVAGFFGKKSLLKYFFFFQPFHIFYTIIAGLFSQFGKYEWKGRRVR